MYRDFPGADPPLIPPVKVEWSPALPEVMVQIATGEVATPVFTNTATAFGLGAIGIFASMFLSFLDRRRDLGIMKTLGIDNRQTAWIVSVEVVFSGVLGTLLGIVTAAIITGYYLKGISGHSIAIPWTAVVAGAGVSSLILYVATYVPRAMAHQGTVMELLYGRPIPIYRDRR
jgi:ABC-type antimicrobial peptide transport system permease subunit